MGTFKIVGVVGQMRSGTSAVAEIVHRLGVPMGLSFGAPVAPTYRFEWEDMALSLAFGRYWVHGLEPAMGIFAWWDAYMADRFKHATRLGLDRWGFKTPPWCLLGDTLLSAARKLACTALIEVDRPQPNIDSSVRRAFPPGLVDKALIANASIKQKIRDLPTVLKVPYLELVEQPALWVGRIAGVLEVDDQDRIQDAIRNVLRPTTWHSSPRESSEQERASAAGF